VSPAAARRLAVAVVLAVHDRDRARLAELVADVPVGSVLTVIEHLAALADEGLTVATRDPDAAREALAGVALDLAAD
jgi:MinD-like ATPase involved in chromosome partitioning or flagellar assembly